MTTADGIEIRIVVKLSYKTCSRLADCVFEFRERSLAPKTDLMIYS